MSDPIDMYSESAVRQAFAQQMVFGMMSKDLAVRLMDPAERAACDLDIPIESVVLLAEERGKAQWEDEYGE